MIQLRPIGLSDGIETNLDRVRRNKMIEWNRAIQQLRTTKSIAPNTARAYAHAIGKFREYINKPLERVSLDNINDYIVHLKLTASESKQHMAINSIRFFNRHILGIELDSNFMVGLDKKPEWNPIILSAVEVKRILILLEQPYSLIVELLYGCGLKLNECLTLRLFNINFVENKITILNDKGLVKRVNIPTSSIDSLKRQVSIALQTYEEDMTTNFYGSFMSTEFSHTHDADPLNRIWQYLFPAINLTTIKPDYKKYRSHIHATHVQRAIKKAVIASGSNPEATASAFRHSCCVRLLEAGYNTKIISELMGHTDDRTTKEYKKFLVKPEPAELISPLDVL